MVVTVTGHQRENQQIEPEYGRTRGPLGAKAQDAASYELHFAVQDSGIGIPEERMNRLFQPFSQIDASTTRRHGGTGLGLVVSKRLTELMGGTMWVESQVNWGSTFHFTISAEADPSQPPLFICAVINPLLSR